MTESEFSELFLKYRRDIFRVAYCCLNNTADADDVTQDTFLKLSISDVEFADETHIKAWLIKVAINECRNIGRVLRRKKPELLDENTVAAEQNSGAELLEIIMRLKPKARVALYMRYCEGYSVREIAEAVGANPTTVTTRLMRGRNELRALLEKEGYNGL